VGHVLLARAGFPHDQHRLIDLGTPTDSRPQQPHGSATAPEDVGKARSAEDGHPFSVRLVVLEPGQLSDGRDVGLLVLVLEVLGDRRLDQIDPEGLLLRGLPAVAGNVGVATCQVQEGFRIRMIASTEMLADARRVRALGPEDGLTDGCEIVLPVVDVAPAAIPGDGRPPLAQLQSRSRQLPPVTVDAEAAHVDLAGRFRRPGQLGHGPPDTCRAGDKDVGLRVLQQYHCRRTRPVYAVVRQHRHGLSLAHLGAPFPSCCVYTPHHLSVAVFDVNT